MTNVRSFTVSATAALLLVAGGGCADDGNDPGATDSPSPSSSTPSPPSSTPQTASEMASEAAAVVARNYFAEVDTLRQHPGRPLDSLKSVATSVELSAQQRLLQSQRRRGLRQVGDTDLVEVTVQSVNLDNSDPQAGKVPTVQVDVCWDVTKVDVVDRSGESVVSPSRPDTGWIRLAVANYQWSSDPKDGWRVASSQDLEQTPCATS
jgi:hypothetical protein